MKQNRLPLLFLILLVHLVAFAGPRSFQRAKQIAERQAALHGIVMDESATSQAKSVGRRVVSSDTPAYYVFPNGENKGFTIVSGDDLLPEIVGYSVNGTYDESSLPVNFVNFMKAYQEMAEAVEKGDAQATRNLAEVKALRSQRTSGTTVVSPLLGEIKWNQAAPFNNMCPKYDGTTRAVTGCVATAMAQVMMYYKYPKQLQEDIPAYSRRWNGNVVSVPAISKGEGVYDWDNMLPVYGKGSYNDAQAEAVAKLMYHCGAAVKMGYGSQSGASLTVTPMAKYFGYDADMMMNLVRSSYTLAEWTQIIDNELKAGRPILYSGQSSAGGHEFVCDGADGTGLYHINWGWGGSQNGYFDVSILNPAKGGIGSGDAPDGYNRDCSMIVGLAPDNGKADDPVAPFTPVAVAYYNGYSKFEIAQADRNDASGTFELKAATYFYNQGCDNKDFYVALGILKDDGTYTPISSTRKRSFDGMTSDGQTTGFIEPFDFWYAFPVGKTSVHAIYSTDGTHWTKCAYNGMQPYVVEATDRKLSVVKSQLSADVTAETELLAGMSNTFKVTVTNDADFEYLGLLDVYKNTSNTMPSAKTDELYVVVPAHSTITRTVELTPEAGDLYLWISDGEANVVLVNGKQFAVAVSSAPVLSVVKAWSNATPESYETEDAVFHGYKVSAPKVYDEKVVFSYDVKNDGGTATVSYTIIGVNCETMTYTPTTETVRLPGNGEVTTLSRAFTPEEVGGSKTIYSDLLMSEEYSCALPSYQLEAIGTGGSFPMTATEMIAYVAGKTTGVSSVSTTSSYVRGGKGCIGILPDTSKRLNIYNLNGQKVADVNLVAGEQQSIVLKAGIYIVDGKKIIVR